MRTADSSWIAAAVVVQCLLARWTIHGYLLLLPAKTGFVGALSPLHHRVGRASSALFFPVPSSICATQRPDEESSSSSSSGSSIDQMRGKGSQGEWAEWENDAHVDDEYSSDTEDDDDSYSYTGTGLLDLMKYESTAIPPDQTMILSSNLQTQPSAANSSVAVSGNVTSGSSTITITTAAEPMIRDPDYWKGWSEEAPYFDEYDVQDDEGNWGRADESSGGDTVFGRGSSDLWTRATPSPLVPAANASTQPLIPAIGSLDDAVTATILSRLQQLETRLDARLDAISSSLQTAAATGPTSADRHPLPTPADHHPLSSSADHQPLPISTVKLQLPPPAVVVLYMVLFVTIQALLL